MVNQSAVGNSQTNDSEMNTFLDNVVFKTYFWIYFGTTMFSQISVILLVVFKTPTVFKDFRKFLLNSSLLQIIMCIIVVFTQVRPVINPDSIAYLFSGQCKRMDANVCFIFFDFFQLAFDASAFAIPITLFYKYIKVTNMSGKDISHFQVKLIIFSSYILSIVVGMLYIITYRSDESFAVELETRALHSEKFDFKEYAVITGYQNHFWSSLTNFLNMLSIYSPPLISLILIRMIHVKLSCLKHMFTGKTAAQAKKFDLVLKIQTLVPAVCVIPIYTLNIGLQNYDFWFQSNFEKILYIMLSLPTAIDAFIVIFTITPYREAFLKFFFQIIRCKRSSPQVTIRILSKTPSLY